mgnify:CR=1 FL=1
MRIGTLFRLFRLSWNLTIRRFAALVDMPYSSLSALENGWLPPTPQSVDRLVRYIATFQPEIVVNRWHRFLAYQYTREYIFRVSADLQSLFPFCLAAAAVLRALFSNFAMKETFPEPRFIDLIPISANQDFTHPGRREDMEKERTFFLTHLIQEALSNTEPIKPLSQLLDFPPRVKFAAWILHDTSTFIRERDAYRFPLTEPPKRIQKILAGLPPVSGRKPRTVSELLFLLKPTEKGLPEWVPSPFSALDLLLLLADSIHLNPLQPGALTVVLPLENRYVRITAYTPPSLGFIKFPGVDFGEPYLSEETIPRSNTDSALDQDAT